MIVYESIYELIVRYYQITGDTQNDRDGKLEFQTGGALALWMHCLRIRKG
jgi:hypothetical protein